MMLWTQDLLSHESLLPVNLRMIQHANIWSVMMLSDLLQTQTTASARAHRCGLTRVACAPRKHRFVSEFGLSQSLSRRVTTVTVEYKKRIYPGIPS